MTRPRAARALLLGVTLISAGLTSAGQSDGSVGGTAGGADVPAVAGEAFAGLTVVAYGDQVVDIFTGVTTLPEGGQVIDRENGVTLTAQHIRYREGEFVEAQEVEVSGEFGVAHASEVYIDLAEGRLDATGEVRFERDDLGLNARALHYFPDDSVVLFEGPVTGVGAAFEGAAALYDGTEGVLLLAAPYRYQDELFELSADREGALLSLTPAEGGAMVASSRVSGVLMERVDEYLSGEYLSSDDAGDSRDPGNAGSRGSEENPEVPGDATESSEP